MCPFHYGTLSKWGKTFGGDCFQSWLKPRTRTSLLIFQVLRQLQKKRKIFFPIFLPYLKMIRIMLNSQDSDIWIVDIHNTWIWICQRASHRYPYWSLWPGLDHIFFFMVANTVIVFTAPCGIEKCPRVKEESFYYKSGRRHAKWEEKKNKNRKMHSCYNIQMARSK